MDELGKSVNSAGKSAKFESDLLKTYECIAPQVRQILNTFVWWGP